MSAGSQEQLARPLYTIQQIELIRRLRNSGLTKEQVVQAFDSFEKVEAELGNVYTIPITLSQLLSASLTRAASARPESRPHQPSPLSVPLPVTQHSSLGSNLRTAQAANLSANAQNSASEVSNAQQATAGGLLTGHVNRRFPMAKRPKEVKLEPDDSSVSSSNGEVDASASPLTFSEGTAKEVDEFLKKGSEQMRKEIQDFVCSGPAFVCSDIATAVGVDVTSTTHFLMGNFSPIQVAELRRLCEWFLGARLQQKSQQQQQQQCNAQTSKILQGVLQERLNGAAGNGYLPMDMSMDAKPGDFFPGGGLTEPEGIAVNFTPRRERFTFRKQHLEVLENYFKKNQYPTYEERSDIAQRCNDIMEVVSGRPLGEKERMTPQNVAYWFSNRRKDIKRMAREGGIEMSEVILPSKVKQASSIPVIEKDSSVFNAVWPMDTAVGSYSSMDMPSVGPVAFPTMPQRSISETNTTMDTGGSVSHSDSAADTVIVKMEPVEPELTFDAAPTTSGPGSVVDRIATAISSQLMSKSGESTGLNDGVMTTAQIVTDHSSTVSEGSGDPTVDQTSSG